MADFPGTLPDAKHAASSTWPGRVPEAYQSASQHTLDQTKVRVNSIGATTAPIPKYGGVLTAFGAPVTPTVTNFPGQESDLLTPAYDWFEDFHILPRSIALGNVLTAQSVPLEVYSAFRRTAHDWTGFVNNAGAGVTLTGLPPLPHTFPPQSGLQMSVDISPSGTPKVDTTLDFTFDNGFIAVPITLDRVVLFAVQPELPYEEILEFLTDVVGHRDGSEQRVSPRQFPRQIFTWSLIMDDGAESARFWNTLFDWQGRIFGVPMWHEMTFATAAASAGAVTIPVSSTANADYRVGKLVLIYQDQTHYDVLEVASFTGTSVTFSTPLIGSYTTGAMVLPLRTGYLDRQVVGARYSTGVSAVTARFIVEDNEVDLADTSAFAAFNGKVLLSDLNGVVGTAPDSLDRDIIVYDGGTGKFTQIPAWDRGRRSSSKSFLISNQAGLWNVRRLMHALRGRQVSFYIPTFMRDLVPTATLSISTNTLQVSHVGYTQFVRARQPKNVIQVLLNDGTSIIKTVTGSSVLDANNEVLTLNSNWSSTITVAQVKRISYVEKARFDSDAIKFAYSLGDRFVRVTAPVKAVLE